MYLLFARRDFCFLSRPTRAQRTLSTSATTTLLRKSLGTRMWCGWSPSTPPGPPPASTLPAYSPRSPANMASPISSSARWVSMAYINWPESPNTKVNLPLVLICYHPKTLSTAWWWFCLFCNWLKQQVLQVWFEKFRIFRKFALKGKFHRLCCFVHVNHHYWKSF